MKMSKLIRSIAKELAAAGMEAKVVYADGVVTVEAEDDTLARDLLGFDSFTGYIDGIEVIVL
jgi:hypothetical protein